MTSMTKKTLLALAAALAVTTSLSTGAEARGFGGGHFGGGGSMFRSAPMKMSTFKAAPVKTMKIAPVKTFKASPSFKSKPFVAKHTVKPAKTFVHKETKTLKHVAKHDLKPKLESNKGHVTKNFDKLKANKVFAKKLDAKKLGVAKLAPAKLNVAKLKLIKPGNAELAFGPPVKSLKLLSAAHLAKAMPFDAMGKKYSMSKKAWWDGKHWWAGALAWTFVGGYWYYGDELWYEDDGVWRTESGFAAECLDCGPVVVTRTRVASVGYAPSSGGSPSQKSASTSGGSSSVAGSSGGSASSGNSTAGSSDAAQKEKPADKPVKTAGNDGKTKTTTEMSTEAVLIKSNTSGLPGTEGEPAGEPATAAADPAEPVGVKVAAAVDPTAPMTDAGSADPEVSPAIDCKRFVPAVSMTISVPCGN